MGNIGIRDFGDQRRVIGRGESPNMRLSDIKVGELLAMGAEADPELSGVCVT